MIKKSLVILSLFLFFIPTFVFAGDGNIHLNGVNTIGSGSTFSISLVANVTEDALVTSGGQVSVDGDCITLVNITKEEADVEKTKFSYMNLNGKSGNITLVTMNLRAKNTTCSGFVRVNEGTLSFTDGTSKNLSAIIKDIQVVSANNNLKNLSLSSGSISFSPMTTNYNVYVGANVTTLAISGEVEEENATVTGLGTKTLNYGNNKFTVTVTAKNGDMKTYTINVNREDNRIFSSGNTTKEVVIKEEIKPVENTSTSEKSEVHKESSIESTSVISESNSSENDIDSEGTPITNPTFINENNPLSNTMNYVPSSLLVNMKNESAIAYAVPLKNKVREDVLNNDSLSASVIPSTKIVKKQKTNWFVLAALIVILASMGFSLRNKVLKNKKMDEK